MAKTWLKLDTLDLWTFTIWSLACLEVKLLGPDGSVLLSIVAKALRFLFQCCVQVSLSPSFGDAVGGNQYEV
jgi:hypothetical protein